MDRPVTALHHERAQHANLRRAVRHGPVIDRRQLQHPREPLHGPLVRMPNGSPFDVADGPDAQPGPGCQVALRQAS